MITIDENLYSKMPDDIKRCFIKNHNPAKDEVLELFPNDAARFFYCAKASASERDGSTHPTMKPIALMRYLCRLVTPPNGTVLEPFAGSGTTAMACIREGFKYIAIERESEYCAIASRRIESELDQMRIEI